MELEWKLSFSNRVVTAEFSKFADVLSAAHSQEMTLHMDITRWSILKSDWLYSLQVKMEKLYTAAKTRLGDDCGSDNELLIAKFNLLMKVKESEKVGLKLNIQKMKIMASSPITSWQIDGETI